MTRRLILHVGPHKTGTTSVQHWLMANAAALHAAGIAQPLDLLPPNGNALTIQFGQILVAPPSYRDSFEAFRAFCMTVPAHDVILSAEDMSYLMLRAHRPGAHSTTPIAQNVRTVGPSKDARSFSAIRSESLENLKSLAADADFSTAVFVFVARPSEETLSSAYLQKLKRFNGRFSLGARLPVWQLADSARDLEAHGFAVRYLAHQRASEATAPLWQRILHAAGHDLAADRFEPAFAEHNVSPGALQAIALGHVFHALEQQFPDGPPEGDTHLINRVRAMCRKLAFEGDAPFVLLTPAAALGLRAEEAAGREGIERWMSADDAALLRRPLPAPPAQSPLGFRELGRDDRVRVRRWLNLLARKLEQNRFTRAYIDTDRLRAIPHTAPGMHSSGIMPPPCIMEAAA